MKNGLKVLAVFLALFLGAVGVASAYNIQASAHPVASVDKSVPYMVKPVPAYAVKHPLPSTASPVAFLKNPVKSSVRPVMVSAHLVKPRATAAPQASLKPKRKPVPFAARPVPAFAATPAAN